MNNVILYCRVASKNKEDQIKSFERQERELREFCAGNELVVKGVIREVKSGKTPMGKTAISFFERTQE